MKLRYIIYKKFGNGTRTKYVQSLSSHKCTYEDFYNQTNYKFDLFNLKTFECFDNTDHIIEGTNDEDAFLYYEFSVSSKENTQENFDRIGDYLKQNNCKIVIYYTDTSFDLNNYKDPIKPLLGELSIQLNPILFIKMDAYFMNQYFTDDNNLILILMKVK